VFLTAPTGFTKSSFDGYRIGWNATVTVRMALGPVVAAARDQAVDH